MDVPVNRIEYLAEHLFSLVLLAEIKSYERISGTGGEIQKFCNMSVAPVLSTRILPVAPLLYTRVVSVAPLLYTWVVSVAVLLYTRVVSVAPLLYTRVVSVAPLLYTRVVPLVPVLYTRVVPLGVILYTRVVPLGVILYTRVLPLAPFPSTRVMPLRPVLHTQVVSPRPVLYTQVVSLRPLLYTLLVSPRPLPACCDGPCLAVYRGMLISPFPMQRARCFSATLTFAFCASRLYITSRIDICGQGYKEFFMYWIMSVSCCTNIIFKSVYLLIFPSIFS